MTEDYGKPEVSGNEVADEIGRGRKAKPTEKDRRIYYQSIVYDVCNIIDRNRGDKRKTVCGTVETPCDEVQKTLSALLANMEPRF